MVCVRNPSAFDMGSPAYELGRFTGGVPTKSPKNGGSDEDRHEVNIPRDFAVAATATTARQFEAFLSERPDVKAKHEQAVKARFSRPEALTPSPDCPAVAITWYEAAQYCNWLSIRDGLPTSEWCFPEVEGFESGLLMPSNYLQRTGYRLLTEAEWEYVARAGTTTSRFFGLSVGLLPEYVWSREASNNTSTIPVGCLKPNELGLFDVLGNVWEWCLDRRQPYPTQPGAATIDQEDSQLVVDDSIARTRRGGSFTYDAPFVRSACRGDLTYFPMQRKDSVGFRVARTLPRA